MLEALYTRKGFIYCHDIGIYYLIKKIENIQDKIKKKMYKYIVNIATLAHCHGGL